MNRKSVACDRVAYLEWAVTVSDPWTIPARGHGVRYLQRKASPMVCVHCVRVALAIVSAVLVYAFA